MTLLRGRSVSWNTEQANGYNDTIAVFWFPFTIPAGWDMDPFSVTVVGGLLTDTTFPTAVTGGVSGLIVTVNAGVANAGPYSGSGHSYAPGTVIANFGGASDYSWSAEGDGQGASFNVGETTNGHVVTLIDGTPTYAGEGVWNAPPLTGPVGWSPGTNFVSGDSPPYPTLSAGQTVSFNITLFGQSNDSANPNRTVYPVLKSLVVTADIGAGSVDYPIDLTTVKAGFNAGGTGVTTSFGVQTWNALHTVTTAQPSLATSYQDPWLVASQASQGYIF